MLNIQENVDLKSFTTLGVSASARFFGRVRSRQDIEEAIIWAKRHNRRILILGGGSNVLISQPLDALVIKNEIKGRRVVSENNQEIFVEALSGEDWSEFVRFTVDQGWYGLENLFLIYGTVGAAPVQNIGAYGVELKDSFESLTALDLLTGEIKVFSKDDCQFSYRQSVFKTVLKNRYFIYSVLFRLQKEASLKLDYGHLREELVASGVKNLNPRVVADAVGKIRTSKLPNPAKLPNAGSFFKNIEVGVTEFNALNRQYPDMPHFATESGQIKIPSGWLIEQAGFKGCQQGPVGMHKQQALVLINYDSASARQILDFSQTVKQAVKKKFGLNLEEEVNIF